MWYDKLVERDNVTDFLLLDGIREHLKNRLHDQNQANIEVHHAHLISLVNELKSSPLLLPVAKNRPRYDLPVEFYKYCLGDRLKLSCSYWKADVAELSLAETEMLELTCERAGLSDGQRILELASGWGALSLFIAEKFPDSQILTIASSDDQKAYIDAQIAVKGLKNLEVLKADIATFELDEKFDRVLAVEMFAPVRNYYLLFQKIAGLLNNDGRFFFHTFTHKHYAYVIDDQKDGRNKMSEYFFPGGVMPSDDLMFYFNDDLSVKKHWHVNGTHYAKTAQAWLKNMDKYEEEIREIFSQVYGAENCKKWWLQWRLAFLACAELGGYNHGNEWIISQYLFLKTQ